jgi:threonine aldolase
LAGPRDYIARARRVRKLFGGGMRQAGVVAAAVLYALDHHIDRLAEDHRNARVIAEAIADTPGLELELPEPETNLIWFQADPELGTAADVARILKQHGVFVHTAGGQTLRVCTHLDVSSAQAERAAEVIRRSIQAHTQVA